MPDAPKRYTIRTVADFLDVPIERLPTCLDEFRAWLAVAHAVRVAVADLPMQEDPFAAYHWVDDGKGEIRGVVQVGEETLTAFTMKVGDA